MPSAVGYQPTLATEMGQLQERITSTKVGSVTSIQAIYVPADDYTDPAPATTFAHLDATTNLERKLSEMGIYPAGVVETLRQKGALDYTIVVSAGAADPAPMLFLAPYAGVTMGEEFMYNGKHVLVCNFLMK